MSSLRYKSVLSSLKEQVGNPVILFVPVFVRTNPTIQVHCSTNMKIYEPFYIEKKIHGIFLNSLPIFQSSKEIASNICLKNISDCFVAALEIEIYFPSNLSESRADWKCTLYPPSGEAIDIPTIQCMNKI